MVDAPPIASAFVDELTPCPNAWDLAQRLAVLPHLLFLDSAERHSRRGRYSYVTADPVWWHHKRSAEESFAHLAQQLLPLRRASRPGLPPFQGGLAGLFGYGLQREIEAIPPSEFDEFGIPILAVGMYDWVISFDHEQDRCWLIAPNAARAGQVKSILDRPPASIRLQAPVVPVTPALSFPLQDHPHVSSNFRREDYLDRVRRVVEYIRAGDCFQVNLSQRLLTPLHQHPLELYGQLRRKNPSPYACYFDLGDTQILSASPEQFLQVSSQGQVVTRPIKGTRPRGRTPEADAQFRHELSQSAKERAENVMIVDLLRNDLGRVCEYGSIRVEKLCDIETYPFVHHLVSEIHGRLRPGFRALDLLQAAFPGGSVTGAPKVRAMEIIAELEPTARGAYCGSIGFLGFDGAMDTNILIRTFTASGGWLQFPVGGGIVADSIPENEYDETIHKAAGLLRALER